MVLSNKRRQSWATGKKRQPPFHGDQRKQEVEKKIFKLQKERKVCLKNKKKKGERGSDVADVPLLWIGK